MEKINRQRLPTGTVTISQKGNSYEARVTKDLFLLIRAVLTYAKDKKGLIKEVPNFDLKFQKKKRTKVAKVCYLPEDR